MRDRLLRPSMLLLLLSACAEPLADGPLYADDVAAGGDDGGAEVADTASVDACSHCGVGTVCAPDGAGCVACNVAQDCVGPAMKCVAHACVAPVLCVGDKQCAKTLEVCDKTAGYCVECLESADCDVGAGCVGRRCVAPPATCTKKADCEPVGWICSSLGECVGCELDSHCPLAAFCGDSQCSQDVCVANEQKCTDPITRGVCQANGGGWVTTPCAEGESCAGGQCAAESCTPGSGKCGGGKAWTCKADGKGWTALACGDEQVCAVVGGAASCKDLVCDPGKLGCVGKLAMKCSGDGITQQLVADCNKPGPDGKAQVCAAGVCVSVACEPGKFYCAKAPPDGPSTVVMKCNAKGSDGEIAVVCKGDKICIGGACEKPALCLPDSLYCGPADSGGKSTLVMKCNKKGNDSDIVEVCKGDKSCLEGQCLGKKVCTVGQTVCDGLHKVVTCTTLGTKWSTAACAAGSTCGAGVCQPGIICAPKTVFCDGSVLKLCIVDGKFSETGMDCLSEKKSCVAGTCVTGACTGKPGMPACGDGCCAADENFTTCAKDCPCSGGKKLLTAKHWCDDTGSKPGWRSQPGLCKEGYRDGWFNGLPCPFDAAVGHQSGWKGPCSGCVEGKVITNAAGEQVAAWRDDAKVYHCCKGKDLMRVDKK